MLTEEAKARIRAKVKDCPLKKPKVPEEELKVATSATLSYEDEVRRAERIRLRQERIRKEEWRRLAGRRL
jgi:hypothetical protein